MALRDNDWVLSSITDYWEYRDQAIGRLSGRLGELDANRRAHECAMIAQAVLGHAESLSDAQCAVAGMCMVNDLHRTVSTLTFWDDALAEYLQATAGTFSQHLRARGLVIHYLVDNTFEQTAVGMEGPLRVFPMWFAETGLIYVCPQDIVQTLMEHDRVPRASFFNYLNYYINEARHVARMITLRLASERKHCVYLDTNWAVGTTPDSLFGSSDQSGVITIFRSSAPATSSRVRVVWPPELQGDLPTGAAPGPG